MILAHLSCGLGTLSEVSGKAEVTCSILTGGNSGSPTVEDPKRLEVDETGSRGRSHSEGGEL